jgi:hypothetical protein
LLGPSAAAAGKAKRAPAVIAAKIVRFVILVPYLFVLRAKGVG